MTEGQVIALSGGVGGAKLVLGLSHVLPSDRLVVVTNTCDDFDHYGLRVCPDTDTVIYTLADLADKVQGWGRMGETWSFMNALRALGGEDWFNLGDGDLALHVLRSSRLREGASLTQVIREVTRNLNIDIAILPMCDQDVSTTVETTDGHLPFQQYFVREKCAPVVTGFRFDGIENAVPNSDLVSALGENPSAIILTPSNPYVSIDPILNVPGLREMLRDNKAPIIAVSPIIGGKAIKGPAAKMMAELGLEVSALEVARHYQGFIDALIIDETDASLAAAIARLGMEVVVAQTVMNSLQDRIDLAKVTVDLANRLMGEGGCD